MERLDLSDGWEWRSLNDPEVCVLNPKKSEVKGRSDSLEVSFVPMACVDDKSGRIINPQVRTLGEVRKGYTYFAEGDVVFAKITPCMENGKSAVARGLKNGMGFGTTEFHVLRPGPMVIPEWLHLMVRRQDFREAARDNMCGGAGQQRVPIEFLEQTDIPIPPLPEQRRIVRRIEEVSRRLDEARRLHQSAMGEIDMVNQAISDQFFSGNKYKRIPIKKIGETRGGIQKTPQRVPKSNPVRYLTVAHVRRDEIILDDPRYFEVNPNELELWRLKSGDVLIIEGNGSEDQIGRSALFRGEIQDCVHQNHVIRIRPNREFIEPDFLNAYINSPAGRREVRQRGRTSTGLLSLSVGRIREIEVPLPPIARQREIIERINSIKTQMKHMKQLYQCPARAGTGLPDLR